MIGVYVEVGVTKADELRKQGSTVPVSRYVLGLLDTGASRTMVEEKYLHELGLIALGEEEVYTASSGKAPIELYLYTVQISLAGDVTGTPAENFPFVGAGDLTGLGVQVLLGRDVLGRALFVYNGPDRSFALKFEPETPGS